MRSVLRAVFTASAVVALGVTAVGVDGVGAAPPVHHRLSVRVHNEAAYAVRHHLRVGITVIDRRTDVVYASGHSRQEFASESVMKVFIATRLLLTHQMHGRTADRAWRMITRSDDNLASSLYGRVGGDGLEPWIEHHLHIRGLGSVPRPHGWWSGTRITARGMAEFYAKMARSHPHAARWLFSAMHHTARHGSDGTYQRFGIAAATHTWAVKQGWGDAYNGSDADFNTTGLAGTHYRYIVVILARGPGHTYGRPIEHHLTHMAHMILRWLPS